MPLFRTALYASTSLAPLAPPSTAQGDDDFEAGSNPSGWSFRVTTSDVVEPTGGNPNGWLHNPLADSFAPIVATDPGIPSSFTGDLRAQGVTRIGVDAITLCVGALLGRYDGPGEILNSGPNGTFSLPLDLAQSPTDGAPVAVVAGQTWYFQAWHRDAVAGPVPARLTAGLAVTFQ